MNKKLTKIINIIGLGAIFALFAIMALVLFAMVASSANLDLSGLAWIFMVIGLILSLITYVRFYKIDKTIIYSILIAILFLIATFLLWKYAFPRIFM